MSVIIRCIPDIHQVPDLESELNGFKPHYERNFTKRYHVDSNEENDVFLDTCLSLHNSRIGLLFLAEGHSIIKENKSIRSLDFRVGNEDRMKNSVSGKYKKFAQSLNKNSVICYIETTDGVKYPVHSGLAAKLLEINEVVLKNPRKIVENFNTTGYIAMLHPINFRKDPETILDGLLRKEEYDQIVSKRKARY